MKKFILALAYLFFSSSAWAMQTPLLMSNSPSTSVVNYGAFSNTTPIATNDTGVRNVAPIAGSIQGIIVKANTAPGGSASYTIAIMKNGAATAITCAVTGASTTCSSDVVVSVVPGDNFSIRFTPASTPEASRINVSTMFNSGSGGGSFFESSPNNDAPSTSVTETTSIFGSTSWGTGTSIAPTSGGTISKFYVLLSVAPGTAASGKSYAFTVLKNAVGTSVTCTVLDDATTCNDTSNTFTFVTGDRITLQSIPTSTPAASRVAFGIGYIPAIDGESFHGYEYNGGAHDNDMDNFVSINQNNQASSQTEANFSRVVPSSSIIARKMITVVSSAPGSSRSWLYGLRINNVTSSLTCTNTGQTSLTCSNLTTQISLAQNDIVNFIITPALGVPGGNTGTRISMVLYVSPNSEIFDSTLYGATIYS